MGIYVNPGNTAFEMSGFSRMYVDKSGLISIMNELYKTEVCLCQQATPVWKKHGSEYVIGIL